MHSFLTVLADRCADNNMRDRVIEKRQLFQRINIAVHRSNANMILSRIPIREPGPLNLRFSWEKPLPTTSKRLRDEVSEDGPLAKTPLCFVGEHQDNVASSLDFPEKFPSHLSSTINLCDSSSLNYPPEMHNPLYCQEMTEGLTPVQETANQCSMDPSHMNKFSTKTQPAIFSAGTTE